jgi:microsomal dipeptidase-like Zn-dependent dipeptidase
VRDEQRPPVRVTAQPNRRLTIRIGVATTVFICSIVPVVASWPAANAAVVAQSAVTDIYRYAGECVIVRDQWSDRYVVRDALGYALHFGAGAATPFRMQATDLGSYLLYGPDGRMPAAGDTGGVAPGPTAGPSADWTVTAGLLGLQLTNVATGHNLSAGLFGRLTQSDGANRRWRFDAAAGCATFPEISVGVTALPAAPSAGTAAEVRGFVDAHVHVTAFEFLGGRFHCGRPWSRYGAAAALKDCPDHGTNGWFAIAENLLSTGSLTGTHSHKGWPDFDGWPRHDSLTHEGTYWKGIERAWRGGLRIMVADLVENRALCEIYWLKKNPCGDMDSLRLQAQDLYELQDYIDAQFKGPGRGFFRIVKSPAEARAVINAGKLAVVIGVETSQPFDCLYRDGVEICTQQQIEHGLQELWDLGVRSLFPVHKFDNAFGGTAMDSGTTSILVNIGNKYMTGRWWEVSGCPGTDSDSTPESLGPALPAVYAELARLPADRAVFDPGFIGPLEVQPLPSYPPGPVCNVRGLTALGEYLVNRMIDKGMIIETDHLSVRARARTLEILESRGYSGAITSHSWGDETSRQRIQVLGGFVAPYANSTNEFIAEWQAARATQSANFVWGIGFGADTNGLGKQAAPRPGASLDNPVTYPFLSFDGGAIVRQSQWRNRTWDFNQTGAAHYGLFIDWIEDIKHVAGQEIVDDLARGAEAYVQMWERASQ